MWGAELSPLVPIGPIAIMKGLQEEGAGGPVPYLSVPSGPAPRQHVQAEVRPQVVSPHAPDDGIVSKLHCPVRVPTEAHVLALKLKQAAEKGPTVELIAGRNDQNLIHMFHIK